MSNIICFNSNISVKDGLCMSNGLTDVFINVLLLSGSKLAKTVSEKRMVVWLAEKDQTLGIGTVGFDICDMPWSIDTFDEDKMFIIKIIEEAKNKSDWKKLDYIPNENLLFPCLEKFSKLVSEMNIGHIEKASLNEWIKSADKDDPINIGFPYCRKHNTLLTFLGCQICNS